MSCAEGWSTIGLVLMMLVLYAPSMLAMILIAKYPHLSASKAAGDASTNPTYSPTESDHAET